MDLASAIDFLATASNANVRNSELECRRYAEEPGQAMSYLLGKREILRLAELWHASRGGSSRLFHDEVLSWGVVPPSVIAWGMGLASRPTVVC